MATPVPHIKSAARKLPIKRKSPPNPSPTPTATSLELIPKPELYPSAASPDDYDDDCDDQYDRAFDAADDDAATGGDAKPPPPFKFHRIWSESDEIRFLQGLLGCSQQGMVFPRDLNLFYDRFSGSMPQPYTRSQLSEKLRRLRKKFRIMTGRITRGQDPARLAPHDKDLLHLCTRLWDPSHAATSPFSAPDGSLAPVGNKRRRPNPRPPAGSSSSTPLPLQYQLPETPLSLNAAPSDPASTAEVKVTLTRPDDVNEEKKHGTAAGDAEVVPAGDAKVVAGHPLAKVILDVFDDALSEFRATLLGDEANQAAGSSGRNFEGRWREQRLAELEVLASRLRLVIEDAI